MGFFIMPLQCIVVHVQQFYLAFICRAGSRYRLDLNTELRQGCLTDTLLHHVHTLRMGPFQEQECSVISNFPSLN